MSGGDAPRARSSALRRRAVLALLYASEGAPQGFVFWYLATHLAARGVPPGVTGSLSAVVLLPWTLKFLWAPLVDRLAMGRAGVRGSVLLPQGAMLVTLLPLLAFEWSSELGLLTACVVAHSFAAATQDVAIDGWMIDATPAGDLGRTTAWMQAGYRGAMWLFGYGLLALGSEVGPRTVVLALAAMIALAGFACLGLPEPGARARDGRRLSQSLREIVVSRRFHRALAFGLLAGAGFEALGSGLGRLLLERGHDETAVGRIASAAVLGIVPGGLAGGWIADRWGRLRSLRSAGILVAVSVLAVVTCPVQSGPGLVALGLGFYAAVGMFTATSYAWFASLFAGAARATGFTACMAATNGCEAWSAAALGVLLPRWGWGPSLIALSLVGLAALVLPGDEPSRAR